MKAIIDFRINGVSVELDQFVEFRLNRLISDQRDIAIKGGDFSSTINLPKTKNNNRIFLGKTLLSQLNKFYDTNEYIAELYLGGDLLIVGVFKLDSITRDSYVGEIRGENVNWIEQLSEFSLRETLFVDGQPTWFFPFEGATTITSANKLDINDTDLVFPTIVYNNTPIADYYDYSQADIFGTFDGSGEQIVSPLDFPNAFKLKNGYFGWREGLTFEDFPPAIFYKTLIQNVFKTIGWNAKCSLFNEDWFNAIILPYVGEFYKYNWKTLAYLFVKPILRTKTNTILSPDEVDKVPDNFFSAELFGGSNNAKFTLQDIPLVEDITLRDDKSASFKKFLVGEDPASYICPVSGRYRIRINSFFDRELQGSGTTFEGLDFIGSSDIDYGWDDNVLVLLRHNQNDQPVLDSEWQQKFAEWYNGENQDFINNPNDVIAYVSPRRMLSVPLQRDAKGSPLSDWEEEVVVNSFSHSIVTNTTTSKRSVSATEFEIEVDLLQNERVYAYWISIYQLESGTVGVDKVTLQTNNSGSEYEIEYLCGYDDINIAENLPELNAKDFISNFIRQFNLSFDVQNNSKTVTFYTQNDLLDKQAIDITKYCDINTIEMSNPEAPNTLTIGYDNDADDRLLTRDATGCLVSDTRELLGYANVTFDNNENIYSEGDLSLKNGFSATRFVEGVADTTDKSTGVTLFSITHPVTSDSFTQAWRFDLAQPIQIYYPSIQSQDSYDQSTLQDLEYNYNYNQRILYYLGTTETYKGYDPNWTIKVGSVGANLLAPDFTIQATYCAFDTENDNPYPTLRYDGVDGLYERFFFNLYDYYNKTYVLSIECDLNAILYRKLKLNAVVKIGEVYYNVLEIINFDPTRQNLATLKLLKIT